MKNKKDCLFCEIYKERKYVVWENKYFYAQFDKFPITPGHIEVIPKRHAVSLFNLSLEEQQVLVRTLERVIEEIVEVVNLKDVYAKFIKNSLNKKSKLYCQQILNHIGISKKPDGYNIGINEGEAAGRTIHHLHIHIIPRYFGDVPNPRGGIRHIIPEKGNY